LRNKLHPNKPVKLPIEAQNIEMLMIRYNTAVARRLVELKSGLLRVQATADAEKVRHWAAIDPRLSILANETATYTLPTDEDQVHASIGSVYCHASSPLRRYADLVNQRIIKTAMLDRTVVLDDALDLHLNHRTKANRRWARDLTFLTKVTPGRIHHIDVLWISEDQVWVPAWKRIIRVSHQRPVSVGSDGLGYKIVEDRIAIFCDPSKRNWKSRVLTAGL
jgi:exoribonuclease R